MMMYLNILFIAVIFVCITDLTDFPITLKSLISKLLTKGKIETPNYKLHLLDCSLCQTFWASLIYIIVIGQFSILSLAYILFIAVNTNIVKKVLLTVNKILFDIFKIISDNL